MDPGFGDLLARVEATSDAMDRRDASGWLVVCTDLEAGEDNIVGCYGPFPSPEDALIELQRQVETSLPVGEDEAGWGHFVKPLYPPVFNKDGAR